MLFMRDALAASHRPLPWTVYTTASQTHGATGRILAGGDINLTATAGDVTNPGGEIKAKYGNLTVSAGTFD